MGVDGADLITQEFVELGEGADEVGKFRLYSTEQQIVDDGKSIVIWQQVHEEWRGHRDNFTTSRTAQ